MLNKESTISLARQMLSENQPLESILSLFRKEGFSKIQSIIMIKEINEISLEEATFSVHSSNTWEDVAKNDAELLESFYDFLENDDL